MASTILSPQGATKPASKHPDKQGPYTGAEYLKSLDDGREVWIYGKRVKNVAEHPAFRNAARMTARIYDALHDPATSDIMTIPMDNGCGIRTHRFFQAPHSREEQVASRDAIAQWARITYGWMGRTPDYKAAWLGTLAANSGLYGEYQPNANHWYDFCRERVPHINHAILHPPIDRNVPPEQIDVVVRVVKETDQGLIVSGAKVVATGAALTHYTFVAHYGVVHNKKEFSPIFLVPTNTAGLKLICRGSYEFASGLSGSPFDFPLSSRMDENDSILILDNVLVPWENVLMYGVEMSNQFISQSGFLGRTLLHGCTRLAVKLDFICGLFLKGVEINGTKDFRGVQAVVGEVIGLRHVMWGLSDAMAMNAEPWCGDYVLPNVESALAYRVLAADAYTRVRNLIGKIVGSGLIYLPSSSLDFEQPELRPYLDKYLRGSGGIQSLERVKTFKLLWDAVGSEFAARHELYEINYSGSFEQQRVDPLLVANATGRTDAMKKFAEQYMAEYDINGWTVPDMINPTDINVLSN
jgi:4-hydroxyphenylacetate 3-monooxygenase